ncbi:UDP-N-acetylmuramate dehydrogenase [Parvibacter caecicola]|uniref:UDP-N-acetylmuramate dehydrogenase n=1 Tax=Parvibacter caecicola TaxID=747645 RepID=UPI00249A7BC8|nr:UDP-N-acetylmuramate dehydrogenase [Parvibacter caecicola]
MARHASPLQSLLVDDRLDADVYPNEPMARHTTLRIGGPARFYVRAGSVSALSAVVSLCTREGIPWTVVGRGSNLLVADEGFSGVVISLGRDFRGIQVDEDDCSIVAGGGALLSAVVQETFRRNWQGLEFAVGTPGTVGGAVAMNAGTREEWMSSAVRSVTVMDAEGHLGKLPGSAIAWGYRTSGISGVVVECELQAHQCDPFYIRGKMEAALARRQQSQPLGQMCCGSVFKNPEGASAAQLIEGLGLKGAACGDAQVSDKHANFIVNNGAATAADMAALMRDIQQKVREAHGIELAPEVRFLGF